ncbi:DUF5716 family protein [Lachnoclostridium sp. Marseille-P6806]|uniref:DUF5716 family protein n=1 Tax=Lachnoclostridium sp. Marseille-P6806 TaxID=2364793 RepID=UPI00102FD9C8|nr:DUF5716 family protein [Lachnoclostridium sp. Marseille-P6806]
MLYTRTSDKKYMVGFDLGERFSQISYLANNAPNELHTFSMTEGAEQFSIPTQITKKAGANLWFVGRESEEWAKAGGTLTKHIFSAAVSGRAVAIEGQEYDPCSLLALFVRRCLALLARDVPPEKMAALTFTTAVLDRRTAEALDRMQSFLDLPGCEFFQESYGNSYYHFLLRQPESMYARDSLLCEYDGIRPMAVSRMRFHRGAAPAVAFIENREYPEMAAEAVRTPVSPLVRPSGERSGGGAVSAGAAESAGTPQADRRDESFLAICREAIPEGEISSIFLIGEGFQEKWMKRSLEYICYHRRVFLGSNLYSRGAACGALLRRELPEEAARCFYLDENRLSANIGVVALRHERSAYCPLMSAGTSWYEARAEEEFFLEGKEEIRLVITPITGGTVREETLRLTEPPERPERTTRIRLSLAMESARELGIRIEDLGFGELFPASGKSWDFKIEL